jgi:CRISPR system Cascade subunit CasB
MTQTKQDELVQKFVANLAKLDAGDRARLKRNAGSRLHESRGALGLFYKQLLPPGVGRWAEDWYFLVATLYPLEKEDKGPIPRNFADSLRRVRNRKNEAGLDRRVERLLDADEQQLPFQLRQAVHFLASNRGRVNWEQLLKDLLGWTHSERYIQRRWAQTYFAKESTK